MIAENYHPKSTIFFFFICFFASSSFAQVNPLFIRHDIESWTAAKFEYKHNKFLDLQASYNLRLRENSTLLQQHFLELGLKIEPLKNLKLGTEGRYGNKVIDETFSLMSIFTRSFFSAEYKLKLRRMSFEPRIAYQIRKQEALAIGEFDIDNHLRYKFEVDYNIKGTALDPALSGEIFRHTNAKNGAQFDKYRIRLDFNFDLKKAGDLKLFTAFEREINERFPSQVVIIGLRYKFEKKRSKNDAD